jgi:hypothetical protein
MPRDDVDNREIARLLEGHHRYRAALANMVAAMIWDGAQGDGIDEWVMPQFDEACAALAIRKVAMGTDRSDLQRFRIEWPEHIARLLTVRGYRAIVRPA